LSAADADLKQLIRCLALPIGQSVSESTPWLSFRASLLANAFLKALDL